MYNKFTITIFTSFALSISLFAQEKNVAKPVEIRAVLHDPLKPVANLFFTDESGKVVPLSFSPQALTPTMLTTPINGSIVLYDKAAIDPENQAASIAATINVAADQKRLILIVLPAPQGKKPAYRILPINDTDQSFPFGESRIVSLINVDAAVEAGEHKISVPAGKITAIAPVKKVNDFNMAQTNFYYKLSNKQGEKVETSWSPIAERQLQYLDTIRRIYVVHATPGALQPSVMTIMDVYIPEPKDQ